MKNLNFFYDGSKGNPPLEYKGIEVELNFEDVNEIQTAITQEKFTWVLDEATLLNEYIDNGTGSGSGIYYGYPFRIELNNLTIFDGYIDLATDSEISCDKVIAKVREKKKLDWLDEIADGFSFDLLYSRNIITDADFINVPYIISEIPDYQNAALYALYSFVMTQSIKDAIKELNKALADISAVTTTVAGVLKIIILVFYIIALIIALIKMIIEIMNNLFQPVKYHRGMLIKTHFERACTYLGLTFKSSIFDSSIPSTSYDITGSLIPSGYWSDLTYIPMKNDKGYKRNQSTDEKGYFEGTFGDFVRAMSELFNAKFITVGTNFIFERRDYGSSTQTYTIPDVRNDFYGTNANELVSNYLIQFQTDNLDLNTLTKLNGYNAKNFITPKVVDSNKTSLIKGFKQPNIPFALGRRKTALTSVELVILAFAIVFDFFLKPMYILINLSKKLAKKGQNNQTPTLGQKILSRVGMMSLSGDFIGVNKLVTTKGSGFDTALADDNDTRLSANNIWNKYHFIESMVPNDAKPAGNQAIIRSIPVIPFCIEDYYKVRGYDNNNEGRAKVITSDGTPAQIRSLKWNIWEDTASIRFAEEKLFTTNLKEELIYNDPSIDLPTSTNELQNKLLTDFLSSIVK